MGVTTIKVSQFPTNTAAGGDIVTGIHAGLNSNFLQSTGGGGNLPWVNVLSLSGQMISNTGYVANNAGLVTLTLPEISTFGDIIGIVGAQSGGWKIAQNDDQQMLFGRVLTTIGVDGFIASTDIGDSILLLCIVPNTSWRSIGAPQGNLIYN